MVENILIKVRAILDMKLFTLAGTKVTLMSLVVAVFIVMIGYLVSRLIQKAVKRGFHSRGIAEVGTISVATRLLHYVILAVTLAIALQTVGFELSALLAAGAVFAVAIGFAMQDVVKNFVSGIILMVERTIKPNDVICLDGAFHRVRKLGFRTTVARTLDDEDVIIPNSKLVDASVKNMTLKEKFYRVHVGVGVTYDSDMKEVRAVLEGVVADFTDRVQSKKPLVVLKNFGNSSVDWEVLFWIDDPWRAYLIRCAMNEAIWHRFQSSGIVIAFPQVDVHFDAPINAAAEHFRKAA
jgi:small-conductance mechanosensitive channel